MNTMLVYRKITLLVKEKKLFFVFLGLCLFFFIYFWLISILRHESFHSTGLDMAVFEQVFWNTTKGRFWEFSLEIGKATPHSFFANHFSPFLVLLVPFYLLVPKVETLLAFQALALTLGVVPIYLFAKETLKSEKKAVFVASVYFLSLFVQNINIFDFHEIAFFIPVFGFCLLFLFRKRWVLNYTFTTSIFIKKIDN